MRIVRNYQTCSCRCFGVNLTVTKKHKIYCCKGWLRDKNLMGVLVLLVINVLSLYFRSAHIQQVGLCHFHDVGLLTNGSSALKKKETKKESSAAIGLKARFNITSFYQVNQFQVLKIINREWVWKIQLYDYFPISHGPMCYRNGSWEYHKTSNISRTLVGNKIVDNSDVVGASPVGAAPTTSSFST